MRTLTIVFWLPKSMMAGLVRCWLGSLYANALAFDRCWLGSLWLTSTRSMTFCASVVQR